jgi:pimeloyl-ACP methyl ester carboxylesterase
MRKATIVKHLLISALSCAALSTLASACSSSAGAQADEAADTQALSPTVTAARPTIVLVHGAFADGTGWQKVIPLLERDGYPVIAVQNPLTSIPDDIATTKRVIDAESMKGPVVVVGHSYGGAVITAAAADNPAVKALVYVNALAPDSGELIGDLLHKYGTGPLDTALVPDAAGFLYIDRAQFHDIFCKDIPAGDARVLAATQKPISNTAFGESIDKIAWKTIPSWYIVGKQDQAINPDLERFMAKRMNAQTLELDASHVSFISHPHTVVKMIEEAAQATK